MLTGGIKPSSWAPEPPKTQNMKNKDKCNESISDLSTGISGPDLVSPSWAQVITASFASHACF